MQRLFDTPQAGQRGNYVRTMQKKNQVFASQQGSAVITEVGLTNLTADASEDRCATRPHALTSACSASEGFAGPQRDIYNTKKAQTESSAANLQEGMERKEPGAEAGMIGNASSKEPAGCGGYLKNQRAPRLCSCLDLCPPGPTSCSVEKKNRKQPW